MHRATVTAPGIGVDEDGVEVESHGFRAGNLNVGDVVCGHLLSDGDDFYIDVMEVQKGGQ